MLEKIYRFNGRFTKRKVVLKKQKALTAMSAAKKKKNTLVKLYAKITLWKGFESFI